MRSAAKRAAAGLIMQFIDEAEILVKAGNGGPGAVAFRREKFAPRGGPSGGDGGNGGDIVLQTDERLTTLLDFRFKREYRARNGEPGRGRDQNGHAAAELLLKVPPGTVVKDTATGEVLADLRENGRRWVLVKGGRGGLGNMNFATSTLQAPRFAQPGTEGEEKRVKLELRLLADVGLVGFPNAGKSTLVSRLSRARPKIADYPFTTLQPHLGVVQYKDGRSFVLTDLPGLIEGAHAGAGLGHRFLKHMQRCRVIVHLVDASAADRDLVEGFDAINRELELFDPALRRKPQVVAANKIDVPEGRERAKEFARKLKRRKIDVHLVSAATGEGLNELLDAMMRLLDRAGAPQPLERDIRSSSAAEDGRERMSEERVTVRGGGRGARAGKTGGARAGAASIGKETGADGAKGAGEAKGAGGAKRTREPEDEREVDRVEKERRSPPEGRRARERKAARVKRR